MYSSLRLHNTYHQDYVSRSTATDKCHKIDGDPIVDMTHELLHSDLKSIIKDGC